MSIGAKSQKARNRWTEDVNPKDPKQLRIDRWFGMRDSDEKNRELLKLRDELSSKDDDVRTEAIAVLGIIYHYSKNSNALPILSEALLTNENVEIRALTASTLMMGGEDERKILIKALQSEQDSWVRNSIVHSIITIKHRIESIGKPAKVAKKLQPEPQPVISPTWKTKAGEAAVEDSAANRKQALATVMDIMKTKALINEEAIKTLENLPKPDFDSVLDIMEITGADNPLAAHQILAEIATPLHIGNQEIRVRGERNRVLTMLQEYRKNGASADELAGIVKLAKEFTDGVIPIAAKPIVEYKCSVEEAEALFKLRDELKGRGFDGSLSMPAIIKLHKTFRTSGTPLSFEGILELVDEIEAACASVGWAHKPIYTQVWIAEKVAKMQGIDDIDSVCSLIRYGRVDGDLFKGYSQEDVESLAENRAEH